MAPWLKRYPDARILSTERADVTSISDDADADALGEVITAQKAKAAAAAAPAPKAKVAGDKFDPVEEAARYLRRQSRARWERPARRMSAPGRGPR